jgi:MOSC domain-containing protein YiiM
MNDSTARATVVSVHKSDRHSFSKETHSVIRLIENWGVEGDSHAGTTDQHLWHIKRFGTNPNLRQVHLIQIELLDEVQTKGHTVIPGDLGENISTCGVDLLALPTGARLHIGPDVILELTGLRNPCHQIENFQPGLLQHVVERKSSGLVRKAGVMSIVIKGGAVSHGDPILIESPPPPHTPLEYRPPA